MGSSLLDADGHEIWGEGTALIHGVLRRGARKLQLPADLGDDHPGDGVMPGQLMGGIYAAFGAWSVSRGYSRLITHLTDRYALTEFDRRYPDRPANLVLFAYDWRLSNRYNGRRLRQEIEPVLRRWREHAGRNDARLVFVCHSMGGLLARWYAEREGGAEHIRQLITIGTPHRGSAMAAERLVNGVGRRLGPLAGPLTRLARSLPALHQLLPGYACVAGGGPLRTIGESGGLPGLDRRMTDDAALFHRQLAAAPAGYPLRLIVGIDQPTMASVVISDGRVQLRREMLTDDGRQVDVGGDGTVPRFAAYPPHASDSDPGLHFAAQTHGALTGSPSVLDQVDGVLTGTTVRFRAAAVRLGITAEDYIVAGDPLLVSAESDAGDAALVVQVAHPGSGNLASQAELADTGRGTYAARVDGLPPGAWEIRVGRRAAGGRLAEAVHSVAVVTSPDE
jgi:hypothetical protein